MDPTTGGTWAVAFAIFAHAIAWAFKSPKETAGEIARKVETLDAKHHALDRSVAVLTREVAHLAHSIEDLAHILRNGGDGHERNSGRHLNIG